jgi:hypothetical protein
MTNIKLNEALKSFFTLNSSMSISVYFSKKLTNVFIILTETNFKFVCIGTYNEEKEIAYNVLASITKLLKLGDVSLSREDSLSFSTDVSL